MTIMDPYEAESLMRFIASVSYNGLPSKSNTLMDSAASLNFATKEYFMANGFQKDFKSTPKLSFRVVNEHRISTTKVIGPSVLSLMDMNSLAYNSESLLTSKVQIL